MKSRKIFVLVFFWFVLFSLKASDSWQTWCEQSDFRQTPRYAQTIEFCKRLADASPMVHYTPFGVSPQGRDLPLLILDREGLSTPEQIKARGRLILMIQACIHPGEPEGKDAGLILFRDMAIRGLDTNWLRGVSIIFIPIFNVDGHERFSPYNRINQNGPEEMGWRTTAQNLNLNRDYLKADAPEMQAWLQLFHHWNPDFFIDTHTTDGADYQYVLTYSLETGPNTDRELGAFLAAGYESRFVSHMHAMGYPVFPYVSFRRWHDPRSGLYSSPAPAMLSHGYVAACNRPALLIETHMLKPYKPRVLSTLEAIRFTLAELNQFKTSYKEVIERADAYTSSVAFRSEPFSLGYGVSGKDSTMVKFAGFAYEVVKSDLTGGDWFKYSSRPDTMLLPWFKQAEPREQVWLPDYYIIPPEWNTVIERLRFHGLQMHALKESVEVEVESYRLSNPKWRTVSYEGRIPLTVKAEPIRERRVFSAGSVMIPMNQPQARIVALLLEPQSSESFMYWGFFNAVLEQKEYAESYVMEPLARQMIEKDPQLKEAFEQWKAQNPQVSTDAWAQLNWFYSRTPWFDTQLGKYPVGRLRDPLPAELRK
ncbi:MAG: M14 family metallopeptidase [Bacteroidales bacterium]